MEESPQPEDLVSLSLTQPNQTRFTAVPCPIQPNHGPLPLFLHSLQPDPKPKSYMLLSVRQSVRLQAIPAILLQFFLHRLQQLPSSSISKPCIELHRLLDTIYLRHTNAIASAICPALHTPITSPYNSPGNLLRLWRQLAGETWKRRRQERAGNGRDPPS